MPALELRPSLRSDIGGHWALQISCSALVAILEDGANGAGFDPVTVDFEDSTIVAIGLHKDPAYVDDRLVAVAPLYSVSFPLSVNDYAHVCDALGMTKRFTLPGVVLSVVLRMSESNKATLMHRVEMPPAVARNSEKEEQIMLGMLSNKKNVVLEIMGKIEDAGVALIAMEEEKRKLANEKNALLQAQEDMIKKLEDTRTPFLTDLDFDLLLAVEGGLEKVMDLMWQAHYRLEQAQTDVFNQWKEYENVQSKMKEVHAIERRIREVENASRELSTVLTEARKSNEETSRLHSIVDTQQRSIEQMEKALVSRTSNMDWECKLEIMRAKTDHEKLEQVYQQVSLIKLSEADLIDRAEQKARLSIQEEDLEERRMKLLEHLESWLDVACGRVRTTFQSEDDVREAERKAEAVCHSLRARYSALLDRKETIEGELPAQALKFAHEIGNLKIQLTERDANVEVLERRVAAIT